MENCDDKLFVRPNKFEHLQWALAALKRFTRTTGCIVREGVITIMQGPAAQYYIITISFPKTLDSPFSLFFQTSFLLITS